MTGVREILDKVADVVLAYRPKAKQKKSKKRTTKRLAKRSPIRARGK